MPSELTSMPALWGAAGALFYAGTRLTTELWGGEVEPDARAKKRAAARFCLAAFFGPIAAAALTQPTIKLIGGHGTVPAVALAIGLSCNALWPIFVNGLAKAMRSEIASLFKRLGAALSNGGGE